VVEDQTTFTFPLTREFAVMINDELSAGNKTECAGGGMFRIP
jgi:hypothetical protein